MGLRSFGLCTPQKTALAEQVGILTGDVVTRELECAIRPADLLIRDPATGKLMKKNTFTDSVACADDLVQWQYGARGRLSNEGWQRGCLLNCAVLNLRPDICGCRIWRRRSFRSGQSAVAGSWACGEYSLS